MHSDDPYPKHYPTAAERESAKEYLPGEEEQAIRLGRKLREAKTVSFEPEAAAVKKSNGKMRRVPGVWFRYVLGVVLTATNIRRNKEYDDMMRNSDKFRGGVTEDDFEEHDEEIEAYKDDDWDE